MNSLLKRKYRRRRVNESNENVIIYSPEGWVYDHLIEPEAWKKSGKIIDRLNGLA